MSYDIYVFLRRDRMPAPDVWSAALREKGFDLQFDCFHINMIKIFRPDVSNFHQPIILDNPSLHQKLAGLNFRRMADEWVPVHFHFYVEKKKARRPQITNMMPCIAFRKDLERLVFPVADPNVELLPIVVSGEDWLIINCLRTTRDLDESNSILFRDASGTIFMAQRIAVVETSLQGSNIFTIDGSNRSYSYLLESFVNRLKDLKMEGLTFTEIGATV